MVYVLSAAAIVSGLAGLACMMSAFRQINRVGWQAAMQPGEDGRWSRPRWMLLIGASLGLGLVALQLASAVVSKLPSPAAARSISGGVGSYSWSRSSEDIIPGIDHGQVWCRWIGTEPALILWSNQEGGGTSSSDRTTAESAVFEGSFYRSDVAFAGEMFGFDDGTVTIAGTPYDLQNGSLFLIGVRDDGPEIRQLPRSVRQFAIVELDEDGDAGIKIELLRNLGRDDAEIVAFFTKPRSRPEAGDVESNEAAP